MPQSLNGAQGPGRPVPKAPKLLSTGTDIQPVSERVECNRYLGGQATDLSRDRRLIDTGLVYATHIFKALIASKGK